MVARVVPQSARRRHAESRKPDLWGRAARPKAPVLPPSLGSWRDAPAHSRPRYRPPAAEAHDMDLTRLPKVSATS